MRRGHPGIAGWRSDNPRHFRPRTGGPPRFRPPGSYTLLEPHRFPPPGPRHRSSHPYNTHSIHSDEHGLPENHERNNYRNNQQHNSRIQDRHTQRPRHSYPYSNMNKDNNTPNNPYKYTSNNYYKDVKADSFHVNSLGDIDQRQLSQPSHAQDSYGSHRPSPWAHHPPDQSHYYEDRSPQKYYRHHDLERQNNESNKLPVEYTGHRPPSSDHYGSTSTTAVNNNNTAFSRSVGDTVDIVRQRLLNRNDPQRLSQDAALNQSSGEQESSDSQIQHQQQEQPVKKRVQRQRQTAKLNCDKMKSNIVHQLFKIDKDKMHKLMDDPSSSTKFEYAISSLITESQNSLNRHMRSVAEKSLISNSTDFIHNDNNTIYEDTFMKQMQCLLDPQDTVLLEDIKPLVMAELSKVLQLDDFEPRYDTDDRNLFQTRDDQHIYPHYDHHDYEQYPQELFYDVDQDLRQPPASFDQSASTSATDSIGQNYLYDTPNVKQESYQDSSPLFERRPTKKSEQEKRRQSSENQRMQRSGEISLEEPFIVNRRQSIDNQRIRRNTDQSHEESFNSNPEPLPLFDSNAEQLSEDEDTFAELDRQYHVAVDLNFLDDVSAKSSPNHLLSTENNPVNIKKEHDGQRQSFDKSPLELLALSHNDGQDVLSQNERDSQIKQELLQSPDFPKENSTPSNSNNKQTIASVKTKQDNASKCNNPEPESEKSERSNVTKSSQASSRKRSIDQRPSHRKEKRKKSESSSAEASKRSLQRCNSSSSREGHSKLYNKSNDMSKTYFSIFNSSSSSREESKDQSKHNKRNDTGDKSYSDKYVKRKESRKSRDNESSKKRRSSSSSQVILSPKETNINVTSTKVDSKTKLKSIDMFVEQPKKVSVHHAHRNTAPTPVTTPKTPEECKSKQVTPTHKAVQTKNASTQVIKRIINKETQTLAVKEKSFNTKYCQTDTSEAKELTQAKHIVVYKPRSTHDAYERMKEIDMEIQELLKEKFELYNSLEAREAQPNSNYLGIQVFNIPLDENLKRLGDFNTIYNMSPGDINPSSSTSPLNIAALVSNSNMMSTTNSINTSTAGTDTTTLNITNSVNTQPSSSIQADSTSPDDNIDTSDNVNPDSIVDDFTNIPVEELEQIALETVSQENFNDVKIEKRSVRQRILKQNRLRSESPKSTSSRRSKKSKSPSISLLEQIITDDRPLEDIISLDDLERKPPKHKKKPQRTKPKKKVSKKSKIDVSSYNLKECSVVLIRRDFSKFFKKPKFDPIKVEPLSPLEVQVEESLPPLKVEVKESLSPLKEELEVIEIESDDFIIPLKRERDEPIEIVEESEVNDLQFDMLDVSEDIVIGESCEIKDKESHEQVATISEELILDNSQSSADDALSADPGQVETECRTFDYSTDEELRRDSLTITGHADAVLAIECIENDFLAACLDGNVYHFKADGQLISTMRGSNLAVTCLTIVKEKYGTTVYTGSLDSRIRYYDLETGLEKGPECNVLSPIQTMDRAWDTVFVGTRTGFVLQFECKNNMLIPVSTVKFSEQAILALRAMKEGPRKVLLVASRSENVTIKDAQTGLLLRTLVGPKMTVYTLLFEDGKVYCGTSSHQIHVFDYASGVHTGCHEGGKGAVCLRATGGLLFAGCYDGCIYVYREGETRPLAQLRGPGLMLLSLAVVGSKIIAGYKDRSLYIWKIPLSILQEMIL